MKQKFSLESNTSNLNTRKSIHVPYSLSLDKDIFASTSLFFGMTNLKNSIKLSGK